MNLTVAVLVFYCPNSLKISYDNGLVSVRIFYKNNLISFLSTHATSFSSSWLPRQSCHLTVYKCLWPRRSNRLHSCRMWPVRRRSASRSKRRNHSFRPWRCRSTFLCPRRRRRRWAQPPALPMRRRAGFRVCSSEVS